MTHGGHHATLEPLSLFYDAVALDYCRLHCLGFARSERELDGVFLGAVTPLALTALGELTSRDMVGRGCKNLPRQATLDGPCSQLKVLGIISGVQIT